MSATASYISAAEFVKIVDQRTLKQLVSDTGTAASSLTSDTNFAEILKVASGNLESILIAFNLYTSAELTTIAAETTVASSFLKSLAAGFVIREAYRRRPDIVMGQLTQEYVKQIEADAWAISVGDRRLTTSD